jgi:hypothetical protein
MKTRWSVLTEPIQSLLDPNLPCPEKELLAIRIFFDLYHKQRYHECHDVMEEIWRETPDPERKFFQGLLQCAVALHHWSNGNVNGTRILYREGVRKLQPFRPLHLGVDLEKFLNEYENKLPEFVKDPLKYEY